jgi:RNA-dependent RNA polymerase
MYSILEPGEIYFKSSKRNLKAPDGTEIDIVLGDILITRHPCKLPTDVQKVCDTVVSQLGTFFFDNVIVESS